MPQIMPFLPLITAVAGPLASRFLGGGNNNSGTTSRAAAPKPKALFAPEQIKQATDRYTSEGNAKWNQIYANMQAAGGTGGPDVTGGITSQADAMSKALGGLTTESGYGDNPLANMDAILRGVEGGINPKYSVYN